MEEEKKVIIHLKKQDLASDRAEKRQRRNRNFLLGALAVLLIWTGFSFGYLWRGAKENLPSYSSTGDRKLDTLLDYFSSVWLYKNDYENLDSALRDKAYYGMTSFKDDPYTTYMSAEELESFSSGINMNFVGIGVSYFRNAGVSTITQVFRGSPAEQAGIQVGDVLMAVDGINIEEMETEEIRNLVIGEEGSTVVIRVRRDSKETDIRVVRGRVDTTAYAETKGDVVYLHIYSFGENTYNEIVRIIDGYRQYKKLIIDLRDNGGGYQTAVEDIAGLFLPEGTVMMRQIYADGRAASFKTKSTVYYGNYEQIDVLINENTASAAEVLAIALREQHPGVTLIGTTTYGKGVVQTTYPISDGSAIKLTTSKWLSPNNVWINEKGILPDIEVKLDIALTHHYEKYPADEVFTVDQVSPFVESVAVGLRFMGYETDRSDAYFSERLAEVLRSYQQEKGLKETGSLNEETYESIISGIYRVWNLQKDKDVQLLKALEHLTAN